MAAIQTDARFIGVLTPSTENAERTPGEVSAQRRARLMKSQERCNGNSVPDDMHGPSVQPVSRWLRITRELQRAGVTVAMRSVDKLHSREWLRFRCLQMIVGWGAFFALAARLKRYR